VTPYCNLVPMSFNPLSFGIQLIYILELKPHTFLFIMFIAFPFGFPHLWLVFLDFYVSLSLHFMHTMIILHFYATIHPPSRRLPPMPLPLITSICSFHVSHCHYLVVFSGIYLLITPSYPHLVFPVEFLLDTTYFDIMVRFVVTS
jgi:hypothetical protein